MRRLNGCTGFTSTTQSRLPKMSAKLFIIVGVVVAAHSLPYKKFHKLSRISCGQSGLKFEGRGSQWNASRGEVPWNVKLSKEEMKWSGLLLSRSWILTSAYFVVNRLPSDSINVAVGRDKFLELTDASSLFNVTKIVIHPKYRSSLWKSYNLALIKIHPPVNYSFDVQPICLPENELLDCDEGEGPAYGSGWPWKVSLNSDPGLKVFPVDTSVSNCSQSGVNLLTNTSFCAYLRFGDPLVRHFRFRSYVIGLYSDYISCDCHIMKIKYLRVSQFSDWIYSEMTRRDVPVIYPKSRVSSSSLSDGNNLALCLILVTAFVSIYDYIIAF